MPPLPICCLQWRTQFRRDMNRAESQVGGWAALGASTSLRLQLVPRQGLAAAHSLSWPASGQQPAGVKRQPDSLLASDLQASSRAIDSLINYETVKYFNNEEHEQRRWAGWGLPM